MIISREGEFIIGTPTKCGTTTLEHIAKRAANKGKFEVVGPDSHVLNGEGDTRRRQHRMAPPPGFEGQAYLLVRNPMSRYVSVYEYLRAPRNYSQWGARIVQGREWGGWDRTKTMPHEPLDFYQFCMWLADERMKHRYSERRGAVGWSGSYRSPWVWTDSLGFSAQALDVNCGQIKIIRLEHLDENLDNLLKRHGVKGGDFRMVKANRTPHKPWREYWSDMPAKKRNAAFAALGVLSECAAFGYLTKF